MAVPSPPLARQIRRYGENVRDFFHASERDTLISPLFNVSLRLVLGSYCYFEHLPSLLREVLAAASPEQIAERMKEVAVRPNYVHLNAMMLGYFNGREQLRLRQGLAADEVLPQESRADDELLVDFWHRVGSLYVEAESYVPSEIDYRLPILSGEQIAELAGELVAEAPERRRAVRRMSSITELYTFINNGEARVGVFHHGPYPLGDGDILIVKELVGLRDDFLPWELAERPHVDAVARVMRLRGVDVKIDLFGSMVAKPFEYADQIVSEVLLGREGQTLRRLSEQDIAEIERVAGNAQVSMYEQAASWTPEYQIAYGADLYAALALTFARCAGLNLDEQVREAFHRTAAERVPALQSGEDPPLILERLGANEGQLYSTALPLGDREA